MTWQNLALPGTLPSFSSRETHLRQWRKAQEGNDSVTLYYETFNPKSNWSCLFNKPYKSGPQCKKTYTQVIPLSALAKLGFQTPQTATRSK